MRCSGFASDDEPNNPDLPTCIDRLSRSIATIGFDLLGDRRTVLRVYALMILFILFCFDEDPVISDTGAELTSSSSD